MDLTPRSADRAPGTPILLAVLFLLLLFALPVAAQDEPPDAAKIAEWKSEAENRPLFKSDSVLTFTLVANFNVISRDRDTLSTTEHWGEVRMAGAGGEELKLPVQLRTRGHFRLNRRNCSFVPLRLNFRTREMRGTVFEGQDKVKLVTHCNSNDQYDEYVLREYLTYRAHNLISPRSFRARLAKVTYVDSASGKALETRNGILLEHEDDVAKRMEGRVVEIRGAYFADVDDSQITEIALWEYFVGNTDWSLIALHNIRLVMGWANGTIYPIAYDFDFSGLMNTRYATPDPRLGIRSVRERLYRGPCRTMAEYQPHLARYLENEQAIMQLYETFPGLDGRYRSETQRFLKEFFDFIKRPRDVENVLVVSCKRQPSV